MTYWICHGVSISETGKIMMRRTIHRCLKKLSSEEVIVNIGGKYSLSERDLRSQWAVFLTTYKAKYPDYPSTKVCVNYTD
ncbi:MAG: hypothetical protein WCC17_04345 [Candidatus Nitrosopolaris sp.]